MLWKDVGTWKYKSKDHLRKKDAFFKMNNTSVTLWSTRRMEATLKIFDNVTVEQETLLILSRPFASGWPTVQMVPIGTVDFVA